MRRHKPSVCGYDPPAVEVALASALLLTSLPLATRPQADTGCDVVYLLRNIAGNMVFTAAKIQGPCFQVLEYKKVRIENVRDFRRSCIKLNPLSFRPIHAGIY